MIRLNRSLWIGITLGCNWSCEGCCNANIDNNSITTLDDIKNLVKYSEDAGYIYPFVEINGGDPLIHKDLEKILYEMYNSKSFEYIEVRTNGVPNISDNAFKNMDSMYISWYGDNNIDEIKAKVEQGKRVGTTVRVSSDRTDESYKWVVYPQSPAPPYDFETTPVEFNRCCPGIVMWGNRIYYCAGVYFYKDHVAKKYSNGKYVDIKPNYLSDIDGIFDKETVVVDVDRKLSALGGRTNVKEIDICKICRNNRKIYRKLESTKWRMGNRPMKTFPSEVFIDLDS